MKNKIALITGASSGLGYSLLKKFISENYTVLAHTRKKNSLKEIKKKKTNKIVHITGDLSKKDTLKKLKINYIKYNPSIIINNAGVYINKDFANISDSEIEKVFNVNFFAIIKFIKMIFLKLVNSNCLIININSVSGLTGSHKESIYSSSKHALKGFFESVQQEFLSNKVNLLNIYPGAMKSKITKKRNTYNNLMSTSEVADIIFRMSIDYKSVRFGQVILLRKKYK